MYRHGKLASGSFALLLILVGVTIDPGPAQAGDFVDTRVTFVLGDDNFLANAGETRVDSPLFGFGNRPGYQLFFDNLDSQFSGRENLLHVVLYKKFPGFIYGLTTEAAIVLRYLFSDSRDGQFQDDGTYLRIAYNFDKVKGGRTLDFTFWPVSTDRFRIGYIYDLTWGGAGIFPGAFRKLTPGMKATFKWSFGYAFIGFKTARMLTNPPEGGGGDTAEGRENETFGGGMLGFGIKAKKFFRFDLSGGVFVMGENPRSGVRGELVQVYGGSARVGFYQGLPIGISADLKLYRNDREFIDRLIKQEKYDKKFHWRVTLEGNVIAQTLEDPDRFRSTTIQWAFAGALSAKFKYSYFRAHLTAFVRNVPFILLNVPSFVPFQALSNEVETKPEVFFATGFDWHFAKLRMTLGLMLGVVALPAEVTTQLTAEIGTSTLLLGARRTLVIREEGDFSILPEGQKPVPIFATRLSLKWDLSKMMSMMAIVLFQYDNNFTNLVTLANGTAQLQFERPEKIGAMIVVQARF